MRQLMLFHGTSVSDISVLPLSFAYLHTCLPRTVLSGPSEIVGMTSRIRTNQFIPMNSHPILYSEAGKTTTFSCIAIQLTEICPSGTTLSLLAIFLQLEEIIALRNTLQARALYLQCPTPRNQEHIPSLLLSAVTVRSPSSPLAHPTDSY